MARARNIKPAFFDNDELGSLDPLARLLFVGMWTIADYKGEFEWREKRVKAKLLPYDNCDISKLAINLDKSGFIRFYSDGDLIYCKVVNFEAHQNPHKNEREKGSSIPEYSEEMRQVIDLKGLTINRDKSGLKPESSHSDPADSLNLIPDTCNLNPDTCNQEPITINQNNNGAKAPENSNDNVFRLFELWKLVMNKPKAKLNAKRKSCIQAMLREGYSVDDISKAIDGCASSAYHMGHNDSGTQYNDLTLICRSGDKIEAFIEKLNPVKPTGGQTNGRKLSLAERTRLNTEQILSQCAAEEASNGSLGANDTAVRPQVGVERGAERK